MHRRHLLVLVLAVLVVAPPAIALPILGGEAIPSVVGDLTATCDPLDQAACLLPFPNDLFTVADPSTATGRRVQFAPTALPTNVAGVPWDPTEWNRNDGFSPGSLVLTLVPDLDLERTWQLGHPVLADLQQSLAPDAPMVLLDAVTGERHPFYAELDSHASFDDDRLLQIRPAQNLTEGHRYVVALRNLRDTQGETIEPAPLFRALRDGTPAPPLGVDIEPRRATMGRVFADLERVGVGRQNMFLAWDFTVASERNLTERVLHMRDDAFAQLGDTDLRDQIVSGIAPQFAITQVEDFTPAENRATARHIAGTISVPNYLTPQTELGPLGYDPADYGVPTGDIPLPIDVNERTHFTVPGSRLLTGPDGLPVQNPLQPTVDVPFDCYLPQPGNVPGGGPADADLYGHGLLGDRDEAGGSSTEDLRLRGFAPCGMDWWGMSSSDIGTVGAILLQPSLFPMLADRAQQGFLNFLYLGRALIHSRGLVSHPAFRNAAGQPLIATGRLFYDGNSQGGIMGGALTALAPDFTRAKLGVPGMNYSTLLNRSVDWEGKYGAISYAALPHTIDEQLFFALIQMLWDRAEGNGYAAHMTSDPLANTPAHQVMLQVSYADHQVANVAAEVEGRTIGARMKQPALGAGSPHWSVDPGFGMPAATFGTEGKGQSVLVYWYAADRQVTMPPSANVPSSAGADPHGDPRKDNNASDQAAHWLRTGELLDVCHGAPCVSTEATRKN